MKIFNSFVTILKPQNREENDLECKKRKVQEEQSQVLVVLVVLMVVGRDYWKQ